MLTPHKITTRHEAGHVIAYRFFDDKIRRVSLFSEDSGRPCGAYRVSTNSPIRGALRCLSGLTADHALTVQITLDSYEDLSHCKHALDTGLPLGQLWQLAQRLVERPQLEIDAIGAELLARGELSGDKIERLSGSGWDCPRWGRS